MKNIKLFTLNFPFGDSEQFLVSEIDYVSRIEGVSLEIIPFFTSGVKRNLPSNIKIDTSLSAKLAANSEGRVYPLIAHLLAIIRGCRIHNINKPSALRDVVGFVHHGNLIARWAKNHVVEGDILYSYWFERVTYGLHLFLKKNKADNLLVSRAHGYDIYEDRRPHRFIPFRSEVLENVDYLFPVSESGKDHLLNDYNQSSKIIVSHLGIKDEGIQGVKSRDAISIVSCSSIIPLKRIDLIFELITRVQKSLKTKVEWHHFGDGILDPNLKNEMAKERSDLEVMMHGQVSNSELIEFYKKDYADLFINMSDSEGIPVSIMEAMSFGIPAVARDVGGISEIVNNSNGVLLSEGFEWEDAVKQIQNIIGNLDMRKGARLTFEKEFNAEKNYTNFYKMLIE